MVESGLSPDQEFEQEWIKEVLNYSLHELETRYRNQDRAVRFEVFRLYDLEETTSKDLSCKSIAERFHISESDVWNYLRESRNALRSIILEKISEYTLTREELALEVGRILGESR